MIGLTRKQHELLNYIRSYLADNGGVAPSFEEMKDAIGIKSKSGVHRLITALIDRGFIRRRPHYARTLEIIEPDPLERFTTEELIAEVNRRSYRRIAA